MLLIAFACYQCYQTWQFWQAVFQRETEELLQQTREMLTGKQKLMQFGVGQIKV